MKTTRKAAYGAAKRQLYGIADNVQWAIAYASIARQGLEKLRSKHDIPFEKGFAQLLDDLIADAKTLRRSLLSVTNDLESHE